VFPRMLARVSPEGALAVQMPAMESPAHDLSRAMAESPGWRPLFTSEVSDWHTDDPAYYYDVLAPHAARLDVWETTYMHVLDSPAAIVEWYKSTGLRPFLGTLSNARDRERFLAEYLTGIEKLYPRRPNGKVLFPFRRIFVIAYR
jgi:trans-aconitate 2-methyltransferase